MAEKVVSQTAEVNMPPSNKKKSTETRKRRKFKLPTAFTILAAIMLLIVIISWIPGTTMKDGLGADGRPDIGETPVDGYNPAGILDILLAPMYGFANKVDIIIFILILGGFLNIIIESKALDAGIGRLVNKLKGKEIWLIPIIMILFSIGGTVYGMGEETIALYPVIIPIFLAAGFDIITPVLTILIGAGIGCLGSTLNPFVVSVAVSAVSDSGITGLVSSTGLVFRAIAWVLMTALATGFVIWYALRIRKNERKSPLYDDKEMYLKSFAVSIEVPEYTRKRQAIMGLFFVAFILMIISLISWGTFGVTIFGSDEGGLNYLIHKNVPWFQHFYRDLGEWYFMEISALFFGFALIIAFIDWRVPDADNEKGEAKFVKSFIRGSADILSVCLIIAFAAGIGWLFSSTHMVTVLINALTKPLSSLSIAGFLIIGFIFFLIISIVLPSTSGFAQAVFPIIGPAAYAAGGNSLGWISSSITSFSFANGLVNLISPTSAILMAALSIAKVPYDKFMKASWPLILAIIGISIIMLGLGSFGVSNGANSIV
ncbi:YfcC family protein [Spiroplasma endosymbiont of Labia minor]|uniref:YfcC family protein n=1 Tax=Spiroplasma endosymbiont of Labia minor TaxID=3066305 RepID=UPI0030CE3706